MYPPSSTTEAPEPSKTSEIITSFDYNEIIISNITEINLIPNVAEDRKDNVYKYNISSITNNSSFDVNPEERKTHVPNGVQGNTEVTQQVNNNTSTMNMSTIGSGSLSTSRNILG